MNYTTIFLLIQKKTYNKVSSRRKSLRHSGLGPRDCWGGVVFILWRGALFRDCAVK